MMEEPDIRKDVLGFLKHWKDEEDKERRHSYVSTYPGHCRREFESWFKGHKYWKEFLAEKLKSEGLTYTRIKEIRDLELSAVLLGNDMCSLYVSNPHYKEVAESITATIIPPTEREPSSWFTRNFPLEEILRIDEIGFSGREKAIKEEILEEEKKIDACKERIKTLEDEFRRISSEGSRL